MQREYVFRCGMSWYNYIYGYENTCFQKDIYGTWMIIKGLGFRIIKKS